MPKINRYTTLTGPKFDPLSFEQMSLVPMQLKKQQDALESQAGELGVINANRLAVDDPLVKQTIADYEQGVNQYVDRLQSEGFNNLSKAGLRDLSRQRKDLMAPTGLLGKAEGAYNAYNANKKELGKLYQSGKISADKYQRGLQHSLGKYNQEQGVAGEASFNPFTAVADEDINKKAREIALDIQRNPTKLQSLGFTAKKLPDGTTRYYDTKSGREFTQKGAISEGIQALLKQDPAVVSDLTQRQQLGLVNDPNAYLKGLGQTYEALYSKDNRTSSRSGFFNPLELHNAKKAIDAAETTEGVPYVYDPVESKKISNDSFLGKLGDIGGTKTITIGTQSDPDSPFGGGVSPVKGVATVANSLSGDEIKRFEDIAQRLTEQGVIDPAANDEQKAQTVQQYLDKYKDVQYSNPIVKPLSSSGPISSALLLNTKDLNKTNREISTEIKGGRTKLWDKKGNPVEVKDLKEGYKVEYVGYISPSNILPKFKNSNKDQSVVPHVIQITDSDGETREVYGSRGAYETSKPEFEAYKIVKQTTNDGISTPGLPNDYQVERGSTLHNKGLENYSVGYDPLRKTYTVEAKLRDGRTFTEKDMTPENYETFWYNVVTNKKKK